MRLTTAFLFILASIVGACSKPNPDHCANQQGHTTCKARGGDTIYCSTCVADNNGCVAEPVTDSCDAGSTSEPGTSTGDPSTTSDPTSTTSTTDLTTSGSSSSTGSTSTTGDPSTTTGETSTTTDFTTTGTTSETFGTTFETSSGTTLDTDTGDTGTLGTTLDTTGATTGETDDSTTGPFCGDDMKDPGETCDGMDISPFNSCVDKNMTKYGGGVLKCNADCNSFNEDSCCIATGQACPTFPQKCCKNPGGLCLGNCG
jgi:hypothetical protein